MPRRSVLAALAVLLAAGCATIEGAGKDIQAGGHLVEKTARSAASALSD